MKTHNRIFGIMTFVGFSCFASCQKDTPGINMEDLNNPVSIMPTPPAQWINFGNTTYYSSGFVGDVMPYYDGGKFHIYYLHDGDGASDANGGGFHPIHAFESSDMLHYSYDGKMIAYSDKTQQDMALGTGSVVKAGSTYYFYYTGHNGNLTWSQAHPQEGIMYATSIDLKNWTKKAGFNMVAPTGYDTNNFRDPYVFLNSATNEYWMLVAARHNGQSVITLFTATDPSTNNWTLKKDLYTATTNGGLLECPQLFQMGSQWYLLYSDQDNSNVHYRMASAANGPFQTPSQDVLDGRFFYAAKTASDGTNNYLFGWNYRKQDNTDYGGNIWGGNLIIHQLIQNSDGTLSTTNLKVQSDLFNKTIALQQIDANNASSSGNDYTVQANGTMHFSLINGQRKITTTISGLTGMNDAGLVFGWNRPSDGSYYKIRFQSGNAYIVKVQGTDEYLDASAPYKTTSNGDITVEMLIDNSSFVVNINGNTSLTGRSYWLPNAQWGLYATAGNVTFKQLELYSY
ncbi:MULTISPECIES: hypothetical protein [Chitinophagaceae]